MSDDDYLRGRQDENASFAAALIKGLTSGGQPSESIHEKLAREFDLNLGDVLVWDGTRFQFYPPPIPQPSEVFIVGPPGTPITRQVKCSKCDGKGGHHCWDCDECNGHGYTIESDE